MVANIINMGDAEIDFPDFLVLDASVLLELKPRSNHPRHRILVEFMDRLRPLARQQRTLPLLPLLAFEECCFKICKTLFDNEAKKGSSPWHILYKQNPEFIQECRPKINDLFELIEAFPIMIIEPEDISVIPKGTAPHMADRMIDMIFQFNVLPKDATIIGVAERLDIKTLVTLDTDWHRANGFDVITPV